MRDIIFGLGLVFAVIVPFSSALPPFPECKTDQFKCTINGVCLDAKQRCDQITDCPDGADEKGCDIDECSIRPPLCSQKCNNTIGGYQCSCISGYTLCKRNNRTCVANGPEVMMLITTDRDIRSISLPSKKYGLIQSGVSHPHSVTSYYEDEFIFWTEKSTNKAGIFKSLLDGNAHQYVVSVGVETVEDLAIDWIGRHIYFTDSGRKHVVACDVNGTLCTVVVTGQLDKPRGITVYPEERLLFWSDWGSRPHIGSSGMDGSIRKDIVTTDIAWPNGLAVDETIQRIFWSDAKLSRIESSRLDGTDRIILPVTVSHPYAIDVFENFIYWSDPVAHEVLSCNKFNGKNVKVLMKEPSLTPTGLHIHHPSKQQSVENPCLNVICSHLCLLTPSEPGFQCACPHGMTLNRNNRTCDQVSGIQSSVIIATYTDLYELKHNQIGRNFTTHLPTRILEKIGALAFNPLGHSVVYSDIGRKVIYSMDLKTYRETVLFENAEMVEGLDVDPYTENIYWTEVSQGTILVGHVSPDGVRERIVLARGLQIPKDIVLAPPLELMFIVEGRTSHVINVWYMDGTKKEELVQVYGTVSAMSYDRDHLYFSDSLRGTIERIGIGGQDRTTLRSHQGSPVAMDVSSDSVFWLSQYASRNNWLTWLTKQEPKTTRGFIIDAGTEELVDEYRIITVVDHFGYKDDHVCLGHTGGCSDICVPSSKGAKCLCPLGKELSADMHSCAPINCSNCAQWFTCQSGCVPVKNRCDGVRDCPLGEDEIGCRNGTDELPELSHNKTSSIIGDDDSLCSTNEFECVDGSCIPLSLACNEIRNCPDGSDEGIRCNTTEKDMTPQPLLNIEKCVNNTCGIINVNATHQRDVGWVLMARIMSSLAKEVQHQNHRVSLLEDRMKDQEDKIRKQKEEEELAVRKSGVETIQLLRNQIEEFESVLNATLLSYNSRNIIG